jgi:tetratricopeptide (TPR) repeat protein
MRRTVLTAVCSVAIGGFLAGCQSGDPTDLRSPGRLQVDSGAAYRAGNYAEALAGYQEVLRRRPGSARAHYDVGRTLLRMNDALAAREHLTVAFDLEPRNMEYLDALADAMLEAGELDDLFGLLERRAAEGDGVDGYLRLGRVAQRLGLADEAEKAYLKAVAFDTANSERAQRALAGLYRQVGDETQEMVRLRVLLHFEPSDDAVLQRISELGEIPGPSLALPPESAPAG